MLRTEPIQHRRRSRIRRAILLNQVQTSQRNIQLSLFGKLKNHELDRKPVLHNLLQPLVLRNTVLDVNHVIADTQVAEIGDKRRSLRPLRLRPRCNIRVVREIVGAEQNQI